MAFFNRIFKRTEIPPTVSLENTNMAENTNPDILYTIVDEAPELASASLLPVMLEQKIYHLQAE